MQLFYHLDNANATMIAKFKSKKFLKGVFSFLCAILFLSDFKNFQNMVIRPQICLKTNLIRQICADFRNPSKKQKVIKNVIYTESEGNVEFSTLLQFYQVVGLQL